MKNTIGKTILVTVSAIAMLGLGACGDHAAKEAHADKQAARHDGGKHAMQEHNGEAGHTMQADERIAVNLSSMQRLHVLTEMRGLLESTQGVIKGLALNDMEMVQISARKAGTDGRKTTENHEMHKKMPEGWMQLGRAAHKSMDEIAQMAADGKPIKDIQLKLVATMDSCMACHAAYRLPE